MNTEKKGKVRDRKDLQTQVARIKQTIEKVLDKNTSLAEKIHTLFREQGITIFSMPLGEEGVEEEEVLHQKMKVF